MKTRSRRVAAPWMLLPAAFGLVVAMSVVITGTAGATSKPTSTTHKAAAPSRFDIKPNAVGGLDCNGFSPVQKTLLSPLACTDIRGSQIATKNTDDGRFSDNGHYIGHDEPDMTFFDNRPGSGNHEEWTETLPLDPTALPTVVSPGSDVSHWFELTVAPWFGMDLCDGSSFPQLPCTPNSDANAPACFGVACAQNTYPGGGSAFLEMQFYPPGVAPFIESISCDNTHWCASLHINELMCTFNFVECNTSCEETTNFSFVQRNGVPTGPPSPQLMNAASSTPNSETLLMNPGDKLKIKIFDAPAPGVPSAGIPPGHALEISIDDVTTGQSGFMQASAANGFAQTSIQDCNGALFNFEPEYSSDKVGNINPWGALASNVSTEFEIGHFTPCTTVTGNGGTGAGGAADKVFTTCNGPYEPGGDGIFTAPEDVPCYPLGDTHGTLVTPPNEVAGCDDLGVGGDLDFDGSPYRPEWPTSATINQTTSKFPSSFVQQMPTWQGVPYQRYTFQTDTALSEATCSRSTGQGCVIPPAGFEVEQPGHTSFFPYWSVAQHGNTCSILFGNVSKGVNDYGKDAQYGVDKLFTLGYPEFIGKIYDNHCPAQLSQGYLMVSKGGNVVTGGDAPALPSVRDVTAPVVGIAATASGKGYFSVSDAGVVSVAGDAVFAGDLSTLSPAVHVTNIVAIAPTTDDMGYWLIGADGGEFAFGDAKYHGSLPGIGVHVTNIVGMVASPSGLGYLIVGSDGGVFAFGATKFFGSLPGIGVHVNNIRAILPSAADTGYILVGSDGGAFVFGKGVPFHGSLPGEGVSVNDIVGIALTTDNGGYWMAGSNGIVYPFGDGRALTNNYSSSDGAISGITGVNTVDYNTGP